MAPHKIQAVVLKALPYRESSYILHLFAQEHGLLHGVAKGVRKSKTGQVYIERGFVIECLAYIRPNRDLHTLGSIQVQEYYPNTRASIERAAVRDAAFELALAAITVAEPHPELFDQFKTFLAAVEGLDEPAVNPFALWKFYGDFCAMTGVGIELDRCAKCGGAVADGRLYLNMAQGGVECARCTMSHHESGTIGPLVRKLLKGEAGEQDLAQTGERRNTGRVTKLLADYCRYHFDLKADFKAVEFLKGLG